MRWTCWLATFFSLILSVTPLSFYVTPGTKRCLKEEVHKSQMVVGQYSVSGDLPGVSISVTDTRGHTLFTKEDAKKGKFAFTEDDYDVVDVCFSYKSPDGSRTGPGCEVQLSLKHGTEAKDYGQLAKAEKLKPLELELRRLEDLAQEIVSDFQYMREREKEMRDTNESTNVRVLWFSFFSIGCLFGLATWQVIYLRNYFKAKKLIE